MDTRSVGFIIIFLSCIYLSFLTGRSYEQESIKKELNELIDGLSQINDLLEKKYVDILSHKSTTNKSNHRR